MSTGVPLATTRARRRIHRTYTFDVEVVELLNELVGEPKTHGAFLSRLVWCEAARREERKRLAAHQQPA
jgi:hypothetical protein